MPIKILDDAQFEDLFPKLIWQVQKHVFEDVTWIAFTDIQVDLLVDAVLHYKCDSPEWQRVVALVSMAKSPNYVEEK